MSQNTSTAVMQRRKEPHKSLEDFPFRGLTPMKYGAILVDPPWKYAMRSPKGYAKAPEAHYQTMTREQLLALPVGHLAGPDCLLFMWSTWPHLNQALELLRTWGFTYVTGGAWIKRTASGKAGFGTGYVLRSATESFIVGKIGAPQIRNRAQRNLIEAAELDEWGEPFDVDDVGDTIEALRREHSRKPTEMRRMIETLLPQVHACELFAREAWPGHDVWGDEIERFSETATTREGGRALSRVDRCEGRERLTRCGERLKRPEDYP